MKKFFLRASERLRLNLTVRVVPPGMVTVGVLMYHNGRSPDEVVRTLLVSKTICSAVTRGAALSAFRVSPCVWSWSSRLLTLARASSLKVAPEK